MTSFSLTTPIERIQKSLKKKPSSFKRIPEPGKFTTLWKVISLYAKMVGLFPCYCQAPASPQADKVVDETLQSYKATIDKQAEEITSLQAKITELESALSAMVKQRLIYVCD